jgi:hypothetical protein
MHASVNGAACAGSYNASMAAHKYLLMIANPSPSTPLTQYFSILFARKTTAKQSQNVSPLLRNLRTD